REVRLTGAVTLRALLPVLTQIWRVARHRYGAYFRLDCSDVTDFSSECLAELVKLRRDVRSTGGNLLLICLNEPLRKSLKNSPFQSLAESERRDPQKMPTFQGPHHPAQAKWNQAKAAKQGGRREPYFLALHGTRYQRFWLN